MTWLTEDPTYVIIAGIALEILLAVILIHSRRMLVLGIMVICALLFLGLIAVERYIVTPREEIADTLRAAADACEEGNLPKVKAFVSSKSPNLLRSAESILGRIDIDSIRIGNDLRITFADEADPRSGEADAMFTCVISGKTGGQELPYDAYRTRLRVTMVEENGEWKVTSYAEKRLFGP